MNSNLSKYFASTYGNMFCGWRKSLKAFAEALVVEQQTYSVLIKPHLIKKQAFSPKINWQKRFLVLHRDNFKCVSCGKSPANQARVILHIDHILPFSQGGSNELDNLQTLCEQCNLG